MDIKHIVIAVTLVALGSTASAQRARQPGHTPTTDGKKAQKPSGRVVVLDRRAPKPMVTRGYLDLRVQLSRGALTVLKVTRGTLPRARPLPRFSGKYHVSLYSHGLLRDRLHFNFPLTAGAGEGPRNARLDRSLARGVTARTTVRVPFDARINRILLGERRSRKPPVKVNLGKLLPPPLPLKTRNMRTVTFGRPGSSNGKEKKVKRQKRRKKRTRKK